MKEDPRSSGGLLLCGGAVEVRMRLHPRRSCGEPSRRPGVEIALLEVDPTVTAGNSSLVSSVGEGVPRERDVLGRRETGLDRRAPRCQRDRRSEAIASREEPEDLGAGCAEVAVPGRVLGE